MTDFDAAAAAARATGSAPTTETSDQSVAPDHADAEGAPDESDMGSTSRWRDMLPSSDPDPPLQDVENPWNPEDGGLSRVFRAVMKMGGMNGLPAWADLAIAIPETWVSIRENFDNLGGDDRDVDVDDDQDDDEVAINFEGGV